jgi:hypothetical protein
VRAVAGFGAVHVATNPPVLFCVHVDMAGAGSPTYAEAVFDQGLEPTALTAYMRKKYV